MTVAHIDFPRARSTSSCFLGGVVILNKHACCEKIKGREKNTGRDRETRRTDRKELIERKRGERIEGETDRQTDILLFSMFLQLMTPNCLFGGISQSLPLVSFLHISITPISAADLRLSSFLLSFSAIPYDRNFETSRERIPGQKMFFSLYMNATKDYGILF